MGQKVHPIGFRLAVNKDWRSKWFAQKKDFGKLLAEDRMLREILKKKLESASVPNGLAATLLAIRDRTGKKPHAYFGWVEGNPLKYLARFVIFGEGDIAPVTREILRQTDPNPATRPAIHVG